MKKLFFGLLFCLFATGAFSQKVAVKTNLLYDATATINVGLEFGLAPKWTLDLSGNYNAWSFSNYKRWKHWLAQPELRYWTCEKFNGHFFGLHLHGGEFNVGNVKLPFGMMKGLKNYRNEGFFYGAGLGYGYHWLLGKRWSLEAEIGAGYIRADYDRYKCVKCGEFFGDYHKNYWGLTKLAISLVYIIK